MYFRWHHTNPILVVQLANMQCSSACSARYPTTWAHDSSHKTTKLVSCRGCFVTMTMTNVLLNINAYKEIQLNIHYNSLCAKKKYKRTNLCPETIIEAKTTLESI